MLTLIAFYQHFAQPFVLFVVFEVNHDAASSRLCGPDVDFGSQSVTKFPFEHSDVFTLWRFDRA